MSSRSFVALARGRRVAQFSRVGAIWLSVLAQVGGAVDVDSGLVVGVVDVVYIYESE